ncbi:3-isopropylmalate dehydratase small subunit [Kitasatospora sp. NPDC051705]|uniref:3-isopropylmalate dehydratase small subunit n=1 Tax=Kitasatospora sp. NPDC051705 TaxID=3364057 RepID=UPI0037A93323
MEPFVEHHGRAVALRRDDIDTDQILPGEFCKRVTKSGYQDGLFARWRAQGGFVLEEPRHTGATVLLAGRDFGIGSSREHAVWALRDGGFRAVVATGFGDIFRRNALNNGLVPVDLPTPVVEPLMDLAESAGGLTVTVDLRAGLLRWPGGEHPFTVDDRARARLLEGQDVIAETLLQDAAIAAYEARRPAWLPEIPRGAFDRARQQPADAVAGAAR